MKTVSSLLMFGCLVGVVASCFFVDVLNRRHNLELKKQNFANSIELGSVLTISNGLYKNCKMIVLSKPRAAILNGIISCSDMFVYGAVEVVAFKEYANAF